jgi:hypothetical protein
MDVSVETVGTDQRPIDLPQRRAPDRTHIVLYTRTFDT